MQIKSVLIRYMLTEPNYTAIKGYTNRNLGNLKVNHYITEIQLNLQTNFDKFFTFSKFKG